MPIHATNNIRILPGTHLYTWVESSNVDKVSCRRTKSARHWRESNLQPFDPESRVHFNMSKSVGILSISACAHMQYTRSMHVVIWNIHAHWLQIWILREKINWDKHARAPHKWVSRDVKKKKDYRDFKMTIPFNMIYISGKFHVWHLCISTCPPCVKLINCYAFSLSCWRPIVNFIYSFFFIS